MRVITLNSADFAAACTRLEQAAAGFAPDLIVGIAVGGVEVAARMFPDVPHAEVECHRGVSGRKRSHPRLFSVIRRLPVFVRNWMRIIEAKMLSSGRRASSTAVEMSDSARLAISAAGRILVVDDAVDSGNTLAAVLAEIKAMHGAVEVASAVITVTTSAPAVQPDYTLYNNQTLIRFPWSMDA